MLAGFGLGDVHHCPWNMKPLPFVSLGLEAETLLIAVRMAPRDRAAAGGMGVVPVLHVVLLGHAGGTGVADVVVAQEILDRRWGGAVDHVPAPDFGLVRSSRMPDCNRARLPRVQCRMREDVAGATDDAGPLAALLAPFFFAMGKIFRHHRGVLIGGRHRLVIGEQVNPGLVAAVIERAVHPARHQPLLQVAAAAAAGADADQIDRAVTDVVVAVAAEILRREFPVARDQPFLDAAQYFGAALAAIPAVESEVEIADKIAEVLEKGRCRGVPAGPHRALVDAQLRDFDQTPLRLVELLVVGLAERGHADQLAVGSIAPAVIGAGEDRRAALVVAAPLHAAMAARIEEDMDLAGPVAAQDHRFLAHPRDEEIPRLRDLALMADEQPGAREEPLQFFAVDLLLDTDLAADLPRFHVHETRPVSMLACCHYFLPIRSSRLPGE